MDSHVKEEGSSEERIDFITSINADYIYDNTTVEQIVEDRAVVQAVKDMLGN